MDGPGTSPHATVEPGAAQRLADECRRLVDRLAGATGIWFQARVESSGATREERLRELVRTLAEIGREAGSGAPAGAVPHEVGAHALGDQITVLSDDIRAAPGGAEHAATATAAVRSCYDLLWPGLTPDSDRTQTGLRPDSDRTQTGLRPDSDRTQTGIVTALRSPGSSARAHKS